MKIQIDNLQDVAKCVYDDRLPYNTVVEVSGGVEAVYLRGGAVEGVLREGKSTVNGAGALKTLLTRSKENSRLFAVNRSKQFTVLWGTGGIGFTDKGGKQKTAGASGSYQFAVDNSQALLRKFGYPDLLTLDDVRAQLKGIVTGTVKEFVLAAINKYGYNVGGRTGVIQKQAQEKLEGIFADYGLFLDLLLIDEVTDVYFEEDGNGEE